MSKTQTSIPPGLKTRIHDIQAIMALPEDGDTFRAKAVPLDKQTTHGVLLHLRRTGFVEQVGTIDGHAVEGDKANAYRWTDGAKKRLRDYAATLDTLPKCGCRVHVPSSRDDPPGVISCKYCGQEYDEAFYRSLVEELL